MKQALAALALPITVALLRAHEGMGEEAAAVLARLVTANFDLQKVNPTAS